MSDVFEYKGYFGSAEVDVEGGSLAGRLLYIRDAVAYSADTIAGLESAFREAVDDYLQLCKDEGDEPDQPLKGSFNVRVGPERHRQLAVAARKAHMGLNEFVCASLDQVINAKLPQDSFTLQALSGNWNVPVIVGGVVQYSQLLTHQEPLIVATSTTSSRKVSGTH